MIPLAEIAPPLIVEVPWAILGVGTVATFLTLLGLKYAYHYTLGKLLNALAGLLKFGKWRLHVDLSGPLHALDDSIEAAIASGLLASETVLAKWWHGQEKIIEWTYDSFAWLAHETLGSFEALVGGTIPHAVGTAVAPVTAKVGGLVRQLRAEARVLERQLVARTKALEAELDADFGKAWRGIDHIRGVSIPGLWRWAAGAAAAIAALRAYAHRVLSRRISRLEKLVGVGALSAVAIAALTRVFPYWQCRNVKRLMRGVCRSNPAWLDLLFGAGIEAFVVADMCQFVGALAAATRAAEPGIIAFASAEAALLHCPYASFPEPWHGHESPLPPAQRRSALPAVAA